MVKWLEKCRQCGKRLSKFEIELLTCDKCGSEKAEKIQDKINQEHELIESGFNDLIECEQSCYDHDMDSISDEEIIQ